MPKSSNAATSVIQKPVPWDLFEVWWAKTGPKGGETDFPAISFKMVAWNAWKTAYEYGMKDSWDAVDAIIVRGEIKDPQQHEWRNGMVVASNAISAQPHFKWRPGE